MNKLFATIICFTLSALIAGAGGGAKTAPKIDGGWTATSGSSKGKKLPEDFVAKAVVVATFKDGKYNVTVMGKEIEAGTYKVDGSKKPAELDMVVTEGSDKGKTQLAIFKIEDNTLTLAVASAGSKVRPKDFVGGDEIDITVMKRNK